MQIRNEKEKNIPLWVLVPCKALGAMFGVIAAYTLFDSIASPLSIKTPILITYIVMNVTMMIGFWDMRKWTMALSGIALAFLVGNDVIRLARGAEITSAMTSGVAIMGVILLFTFAARKWLDGEYDKRHPFRVFITALVVSQILMFFL